MSERDSTISLRGQRAAFWGQVFATIGLLAAVAATPFLDRLTNVLIVLSSFLFWVVCRYSKQYMAGDPRQARFTFWLCLTGSFVFLLVLSQNLLLFAIAWCGISLSLHPLLQFYSDRPSALLAARKKFLISRLGDVAFAAALILTYFQFGTWEFKEIFRKVGTLDGHHLPAEINWLACLLVFAALLKSAQFPFHSWLPDTMETPTPVSALMHAGIINAGGILVIRLSPLISLSENALMLLCVVGSFTALFASIVMLTQASVKRCLAFSTAGQMGFMMLECGLGAYHLALLHLVAHSLYKAHAFLSTGGVVFENQEARQRAISPLKVVVSLLFAAWITVGIASFAGVSILQQAVLPGIFTLAVAQMLWVYWTNIDKVWELLLGMASVVVFSVTYFALERIGELIATPQQNSTGSMGYFIFAVFLLVTLVQTQLPVFGQTNIGRHFYVHARNGFYINTLANRLTMAIWPLPVSQEKI